MFPIRRSRFRQLGLGVACLCLATSQIQALSDQPLRPASVHAYPAEVQLTTIRDRQSILVQAVLPNGLTQDVTEKADMALADPSLARIEQQVLYPLADGKTQLRVNYADRVVEIPVEVQQATTDPEISFQLDVMPVFMKAGCNAGSCHGAARGKDGFRLSLFGFDPDGDYHRLTREISGRRINLALPEECLMLSKATGKVPHTGGTRFDENSEYFRMLSRWLESGAPRDTGEIPSVDSIDIYPEGAVLNGKGTTQRVTVRARYSDGTDRDVSSLANFLSNNDNSATVSQDGMVTAANRGEAFIMARFEKHTVGTHFIVLPKDVEFEWPEIAPHNYIDELVHAKLRKLRIQPSDICTDEEFLRRVTLDITGTLPTVDEYRQFVLSDDPKKREALVDDLLGRKEFVEMWVMKWAELLQIRTSQQVTYKSMLRYYDWLKERIASNVSIDKLVQELLSAKGGTFSNAATNYYQNETNTLKVAENIAQVFMGMRIQCTQCHNHPFDRWTMDDYYSFAAFFAQIGRKRGEDPREQIIFNTGSGEVKHPVGNRVMQPKFLGGETPDLQGRDRREVLAEWIASPKNPYFARNLSNIVWAHFLGRGIIHEVDDVRVSNPAVNPELLQALAQRFTEYECDFKRLVRDICVSRTYQLSTQTNETNKSDLRNFSHAGLRRLRAEILLDVISQVTETKNKFRGLPLGARAVQIADGNTSNYFLTSFGRAERKTVCACEVKMEPNLSQSLHLLNGGTVHSKIEEGKVVERLLTDGKPLEQVIEELYIRALTRKPTEKEMVSLLAIMEDQENKKQGLEDTFWSLLNSGEFLFNH